MICTQVTEIVCVEIHDPYSVIFYFWFRDGAPRMKYQHFCLFPVLLELIGSRSSLKSLFLHTSPSL